MLFIEPHGPARRFQVPIITGRIAVSDRCSSNRPPSPCVAARSARRHGGSGSHLATAAIPSPRPDCRPPHDRRSGRPPPSHYEVPGGHIGLAPAVWRDHTAIRFRAVIDDGENRLEIGIVHSRIKVDAPNLVSGERKTIPVAETAPANTPNLEKSFADIWLRRRFACHTHMPKRPFPRTRFPRINAVRQVAV